MTGSGLRPFFDYFQSWQQTMHEKKRLDIAYMKRHLSAFKKEEGIVILQVLGKGNTVLPMILFKVRAMTAEPAGSQDSRVGCCKGYLVLGIWYHCRHPRSSTGTPHPHCHSACYKRSTEGSLPADR
eukprot:1965747-Pleurochrysis_carterae.AAC.1